MISSSDVNKVLRANLSPLLRSSGFSIVQARKSWGWHCGCTWVFNIRAVGGHFSQVTGWPPMSVNVWLGIYYNFIPKEGKPIKFDKQDRPRPEEVQCHQRGHLTAIADQVQYQSVLKNNAERVRKDIWWIDPNGVNIEEAVLDICESFNQQGKKWYEAQSDLEQVFDDMQKRPQTRTRLRQLTYFAQHLGNTDKYELYQKCFEQESKRLEAKKRKRSPSP